MSRERIFGEQRHHGPDALPITQPSEGNSLLKNVQQHGPMIRSNTPPMQFHMPVPDVLYAAMLLDLGVLA